MEIAEMARDPEWWPGVLARIADGGSLGELLREQAWAWGGLWAWIQADEQRVVEYDGALKSRAQRLAFEAEDEINVATMEDVPLRKFKVDAKLKIAGKWDRSRYGEATDVKHSGVIGMSLMSVLASLPRAGQVEKVVAEQPALVAYETVDEI